MQKQKIYPSQICLPHSMYKYTICTTDLDAHHVSGLLQPGAETN